MKHEFRTIKCGLISYAEALRLQKDLVREVDGGGAHTLVLCEHPCTLTLGRTFHEENLLVPRAQLSSRGVVITPVDRGGDVTLHAPGQLVAYPILDLKRMGRDLSLYLQKLEETCVAFLADFDIVGERGKAGTRPGQFRGIWVGPEKIAAIGIGVSRWVTYHGVGLNISTDLDLFRMIRPCGLDAGVTSIAKLTRCAPSMPDAAGIFETKFIRVFHDQDHSSGTG